MNSRPEIKVSSQDYERLERLLERTEGCAALRSELERADILEPHEMPPTVVTMNSTVRFSMEDDGEGLCLTLVYPRDADGSPDRVSILAPVGSALLGLSVGDTIDWPRPGGGQMRVTLQDVVYQPERAGDFHR